MKKNMKRIVSMVLAITMILGLCNVVPGTATNVKAETGEEVWTELGNNDALTWQTASADLEAQTIQFAKSVKVTKLRLYVTETYGGANYTIREFEAHDKDGTNQACPTLWNSNVNVTSTLTEVNTNQLENICNGNGGEKGFDSNSSSWDSFSHSASTTEYIEFAFKDGEVELSSVSLWATWCYNAAEGWGNAPKKWKVEGVVIEEPELADGFVELGNNDDLAWATNTSSLESQTIEFARAVKVKKLRLYVTELSGSKSMIREIETLDSNGVNKASDGLWKTPNVTITTNITGASSSQLGNLCNGNGGQNGFNDNSSGWDHFEQSAASETEYIELDFGTTAVEIASVRIWATWCGSDAPRRWKVAGLVESDSVDGLIWLGDNSQASWNSTASATFENQEIVFENPIWLSKLRLKVTGTYGNEYKISEFEAFDTNNINILASVTTDGVSDINANPSEQSLTADGRRRNTLATITLADGMPETTTVGGNWTGAPSKMVNGENVSNDSQWYKRVFTSSDDKAALLDAEYIEFEFDRPYEIKSVKLWSNFCHDVAGNWGNAPKSWEVYGYEVQERVEDDLSDSTKWSEITGFTFAEGKATPAASGESTMYAGNQDMTDYRVETVVSVTSGQVGLTTHYTAGNNYYRTIIEKTSDMVFLYKGTEKLAEKYWPINNKATLAITVNESIVSVWVDEVKMMDYTDSSPLTAGKYGLYAKDATGSFDSVLVSAIDIADHLPADFPYEPTAELITEELTTGDFYVAENGSDSNNGTSVNTPFKTIKKAQQAVKAAKTTNPNKDYVIILRGGTYYLDETITMNAEDGGKDNYRVTYAAYPDETPIISGGKTVTSEWTNYADKAGVYVTTLSDEFKDIDIRQMFVEDSRATRSREPDMGETGEGINSLGYWNVGAVAEDFTWISPAGQMPEEWASLSNSGVEYHGRATWRYYRQLIKEFNISENKITVEKDRVGVRHNGINASATRGDWMYFENALQFVDTPGEWYYDKTENKLYYYPENGANPNTLDIIIPCLEKLIDINGTASEPVKNLDFVGLRFSHTNWIMPDSGRVGGQAGRYLDYESDIDASNVYYNTPISALYMKYAEKINIQDCDFTMLGEGGINMEEGSHSNRVENCTFTDVGAHGVYIGHENQVIILDWNGYNVEEVPRGNVVRRNYFNNCATTDKGSVPILGTYLNHTVIEYNTVMHMAYSGISLGWKWDSQLTSSHHNKMNHNYVYDVMTQLHDGAGIYVLGSQYGNEINNNYVKDTRINNIYFDEGTRFTYCEGNYMSYQDIFYHACTWEELLADYVGGNYIQMEPEDASIYGYPKGVSGDANYDGVTDVRDVVRMKRYLNKKTVKIDKIVADFDTDSMIDNKDVSSLRNLLLTPKVVGGTNHNGQAGYVEAQTDYLTTENLKSTNVPTSNTTVSGICNNDYSNAYDSGSNPTLPEEFVFEFANAIEVNTTLQLVANFASNQGPARITVYAQKGTDEWSQIRNCNLVWSTSVTDAQSIKISLDTVGVTALKVVINEANLTWNHYIISEMDLYPSE